MKNKNETKSIKKNIFEIWAVENCYRNLLKCYRKIVTVIYQNATVILNFK